MKEWMHSWESFLQSYLLKSSGICVSKNCEQCPFCSYCYKGNSFRSSIFLSNRGKFYEGQSKPLLLFCDSSAGRKRAQSICFKLRKQKNPLQKTELRCLEKRLWYWVNVPNLGEFFFLRVGLFFFSLFKWNSAVQLRHIWLRRLQGYFRGIFIISYPSSSQKKKGFF